MAQSRKTVLMADDDPEDCMLAGVAFEQSGVEGAFSCVMDGVELMDFLSEQRRSPTDLLPDLILLDLNMPRKDGRRALVEIKADPYLRHIPIVVLTTSEEQKDIEFTMQAGAESFITKPVTFAEWLDIIKSLSESWL